MKKLSFLLFLFFAAANVLAQPCTTRFAKFGIDANSYPCRFNYISFRDSSAVTDDVITGYTWYFGDGSYSHVPSPEHQYAAPGTYTISQYVYTAAGCADSFFATYTIYPDPAAEFAFFADSVGSRTINFANTSNAVEGVIASSNWSFGDAFSGIETNPSHVYANYGTYNVSLVVSNSQGCRDTLVRTVQVDSVLPVPPCVAAFSIANNNACYGLSTQFNYFPDSSIAKAVWYYGDGPPDTLYRNFSTSLFHTYSNAGNYNVTLTIFAANGCTSTVTKVATVQPRPHADFTFFATPSCTAPFDVQFTNTSTISSGALNINATTWNFDDGFSGSGIDPSHSYTSEGTYSIRLIVRSQTYSCRDTLFKTFTTYSKPVTAFTYIPDETDPKTIHFTDVSTSPTSPVTQWFWDFGDGTTSTEQHPVHTYSLYNRYTVRHTCTSAINCVSNTATNTVFTDSVTASPSTTFESSMGKEFWAGFGYQEKMSRKAGDASEAKLSLYIAAGSQPAIVTISMPGVAGAGFPRTIHIMPDSIAEVTGFPTGDANDELNPNHLPDSRLFYTGISKRGIHISSNQPVGVWEHIYSNTNTAGGSLLLPVNVWGNDYVVQTMGGKSNNANPNAFFFVLAKEDSTVINFTPTAHIVDSSEATIFTDNNPASSILYHAGNTYTVTLNRGEVFNAMGILTGSGTNNSTGADLSGSRVKSEDPLKKIAVFAGNGRVLIKTAVCDPTSGSDNLIQQMFPKTVWGNRYLTAPTKTMEYNIFRIAVTDTATVVKLNGNILPAASLINNSYYQAENNRQNLIESNKRVMVTQYIITPGCVPVPLSGNGMGDPEMIILSPVKYATNNISVYAAGIKGPSNPVANFINVIIPTQAVPSFRLDGLAVADTGQSSFSVTPYNAGSTSVPVTAAFKPHAADPNYAVARFRVATSRVHTLKADSSFTAIAYGVADAESIGYNAGFFTNFTHTVYTFDGSGNWNDAANWVNNAMPPPTLPMGSEIIITGNCVLNVPQTIEDGAMLTVTTGGQLTIMGNLLIYQ